MFTVSARIDRERNSDGVVIPPASVKSQAAMVIRRSFLVSRTGTSATTNYSSSLGNDSVISLLYSLDRKSASDWSVGWSNKAVA